MNVMEVQCHMSMSVELRRTADKVSNEYEWLVFRLADTSDG